MAKRRSVMAGLGALATGSGAVFASGAFDGSTTAPGADLRVISDGTVTVRGNADDDGSVYDLTEDSNEEIDFDDFDRNDLPRATFADTPDPDGTNGNINNDIELTVAVELREDDEFTSLLKIDNNTQFDQDIAIHFEEATESAGENETYGDGVVGNGGDISKDIVQEIYQFRDVSDDTLISPEPEVDGIGEGTNVDIENTAANSVTVGDGQTLDVKLDFFTDDGDIISAINSGTNRFGQGGESDVDLLNAIVVEADQVDQG